jgi:protein SCO1/2
VSAASTRAVLSVVAGVLVVAVLPGCTGGDEPASNAIIVTTQSPGGYRGAVLDRPYAMPDVVLTDTGGRPFHLRADTHQPVTLVFFGYTHCPDICSTVLADVSAAMRRMDQRLRGNIQLVFITTDPARDSPAVIRKYLDRFDPAFVGLTGRLEVIERAAREVGVALTGTTKLPDGGYDVGHSAQVIGFTGDDEGRLVWPHDTPVGDLRHDLTKLAA